jgi:anti-sigma regulatory factor (Ser/Thr protein kinase)
MRGARQTARSEPALRLSLDHTRDAPGAARRALRDFLAPLEAPLQGRGPDAVLLVSELVSNSVRHAVLGPITLRVRLRGRRLRVEVLDPGPGIVRINTALPGKKSAGGRGLPLLALLADRFGAWPGRPAVVWFELDLV